MVYANYFLSEVLFDGQQPGAHLRQFQATDCKSLYDAVIAGNPSLSEKRTLIAVRSIQGHISEQQVRWAPTGLMWADGLTKVDAVLQASFREWLRQPTVTLVDTKPHERQKKNTSV